METVVLMSLKEHAALSDKLLELKELKQKGSITLDQLNSHFQLHHQKVEEFERRVDDFGEKLLDLQYREEILAQQQYSTIMRENALADGWEKLNRERKHFAEYKEVLKSVLKKRWLFRTIFKQQLNTLP